MPLPLWLMLGLLVHAIVGLACYDTVKDDVDYHVIPRFRLIVLCMVIGFGFLSNSVLHKFTDSLENGEDPSAEFNLPQ